MIALLLATLMVLNTVIPAYADATAPEETAVQQEVSGTAIEVIAENADYIEPEEAQIDPDMDILENAVSVNAEYMSEYHTAITAAAVSDAIYWAIDSAGKLTISLDSSLSGDGGKQGSFSGTVRFEKIEEGTPRLTTPWYDQCAGIKTVVIDDSAGGVAPEHTDWWFGNCINATSIDLSGLDTSNIKSLDSMFEGCQSITSLSLAGFDIINNVSMQGLFAGCKALTTIYVAGNWDNSKITGDSSRMFLECISLEGEEGTRYTEKGSDDKTYARIDGKDYQDGYFTESTECTVTLDPQGGSGGTDEVTVAGGSPMPAATMPTKNGYTFAGYYDAVSGGTKYYDADGKSAKVWDKKTDSTLYARWYPNYQATFVGGYDGSGYSKVITEILGSKYTLPEENPQRAGYTFAGWYTGAHGLGNQITADSIVEIAVDHYIYAHWTKSDPEQYTITWNDHNGNKVAETTGTAGQLPPYPDESLFERTGYVHTGWDPAIEIVAGTKTYRAVYTEQLSGHYVVSFDSRGGSAVKAVIVLSGSKVTKPSDPSREGYSFAGWYLEDDPYDFNTPVNEDITLCACWEEIMREITWIYLPGGSKTMVSTAAVGSIPEVPDEVDPEAEGYVFTGWSPAFAKVTEDTSYTAQYYKLPAERFLVNFDTDGGSFVDSQSVPSGEMSERPADPEKPGHVFRNWYEDMLCRKEFDFDTPITEDTTVYAGWDVENYAITWYDHEGKEIVKTQAEYGTIPVFPAEKEKSLEREGYVFIGWAPEPEITVCDSLYTAQYAEKTIDVRVVSFDTNGGSFVRPQLPECGKTVTRPADPQKAGFVFRDWYADKSLEIPFDFDRKITEDMVIYAGWTKIPAKVFTILWKDWDGRQLAKTSAEEGSLPKYPGSRPSRNGYVFTGWDHEITPAGKDDTYTAVYVQQTVVISGGGGGGSAPAA